MYQKEEKIKSEQKKNVLIVCGGLVVSVCTFVGVCFCESVYVTHTYTLHRHKLEILNSKTENGHYVLRASCNVRKTSPLQGINNDMGGDFITTGGRCNKFKRASSTDRNAFSLIKIISHCIHLWRGQMLFFFLS